MNNAAHVATGGEVSEHQHQEVLPISNLGYQWRLVQMTKVSKLETYSAIFVVLMAVNVSIMAFWNVTPCSCVLPATSGKIR
jgi:hypothetical protein